MDASLLYWVIPNVLTGMPAPFVHADRRVERGGGLHDFADELPVLAENGIRAVVCLLNIPSDAEVFRAAGFAFLCLPVPDGGAPSLEQLAEFVEFVDDHRHQQQAVAVHCAAGLGRTGTMLAAYLIMQGADAKTAIDCIRAVEPAAIESLQQWAFLHKLADSR